MKIYRSVFLIVLYFLLAGMPIFSLESLIGVRIGAALPTFSGTDYENEMAESYYSKKLKPGFTGGFFYELKLNESWSLQPELLFTMAGTSFGNASFTQITNINMLELPIIASFKADLHVGFIKLFGGLSGNLVLGKVTAISQPAGIEIDDSSSFNYLAAGLLIGGSYSFPIPTGYVFADIRYAINFTPLHSDFGTNNTRQHYIAFSIGYAYRLSF